MAEISKRLEANLCPTSCKEASLFSQSFLLQHCVCFLLLCNNYLSRIWGVTDPLNLSIMEIYSSLSACNNPTFITVSYNKNADLTLNTGLAIIIEMRVSQASRWSWDMTIAFTKETWLSYGVCVWNWNATIAFSEGIWLSCIVRECDLCI